MARYASVEVKVAPPTDLSLFTVRCRDDIDDINDECEPTQLQKRTSSSVPPSWVWCRVHSGASGDDSGAFTAKQE